LDLEGLRSFLAVAREKSISKAAQSLHVTQPTLSTRIRNMEEGLGFPLLERNWDGVKLTRQGYYFLPYAIQLLQDLSNASTVLTKFVGGEFHTSFEEVMNNTNRLLIGIDSWFVPIFIKPVIEELRHDFPDLSYKFITRPTQTILDLIEYGGVHLGICYDIHSNGNFHTTSLIEDELVLLCCASYNTDIYNDLRNLNLIKEPFLLFDNPVLVSHSHFTTPIFKMLDIKQFHIVDDMNVTLNMIALGEGYTIVPKSSVFQLSDWKFLPIRVIPLGHQLPTIKIQIVYSNAKSFSEPIDGIARKLSSHCAQTLKF